MCGIIGSISPCKINLSFIKHRGPDDMGIFDNEYLTFGHTRLSILDLSSHGHQPVESSETVLTYNGEIYNYKKLDPDETCDTVALLKWLSSVGPDFDPGILDGMFSFAVYFKKSKKVVLCRDYSGIKPLYVTISEDGTKIAFCSEIKGFFGISWFRSTPSQDVGIHEEFLQYGYSHIKNTKIVFRGVTSNIGLIPTLIHNVFCVPARTKITVNIEDKTLSQNMYSIYNRPDTVIDIKKDVESQSMSDVEVGVQMSGGLDSSIISYYYAQHIKKLHGFYVSVPSTGLNEDKWVEIAKNKISSISDFKLHKIDLTEDNYVRAFKMASWYNDEPIIRHPNACAIYLLCQYVKKNSNVKVLLTGEGADELFAGYSWQDGKNSKTYGNERSIFHFSNRHLPVFLSNTGDNILEKQMNYDFNLYLPPILARQDRMSMAHSIEARVPYLSNSSLLCSRPALIGKRRLKMISEDIFGKEFTYREKCGFGMPLSWLGDIDISLEYIKWLKIRPMVTTAFQKFCLSSLSLWSSYYFFNKWRGGNV